MWNKICFPWGLPKYVLTNLHGTLSYELYMFPYKLQKHTFSEKQHMDCKLHNYTGT